MVSPTKAATAEERIKRLGVEIPPAPKPLGAYVETVQSGNLLFITGTLPVLSGKPKYVGTIGKNLTFADGFDSARIAALNAIAAAREHLGTLDRVTRVLKTEVYVVATDRHTSELPRIADGASELLRDVFGEEMRSVRKVLGVASIPLGVPVMVEILLEVGD
jgi:enamine deaminase RidA (YjgF/YER057c/UK114 family)